MKSCHNISEGNTDDLNITMSSDDIYDYIATFRHENLNDIPSPANPETQTAGEFLFIKALSPALIKNTKINISPEVLVDVIVTSPGDTPGFMEATKELLSSERLDNQDPNSPIIRRIFNKLRDDFSDEFGVMDEATRVELLEAMEAYSEYLSRTGVSR